MCADSAFILPRYPNSFLTFWHAMSCLRKATYHLAPALMQTSMQVLPPAQSRQGRKCLFARCFQKKAYTLSELCSQSKKLPSKTCNQNGRAVSAVLPAVFALTNGRWANSVAECKEMPFNLSTNPRLLRRQWPFIQQALADRFAEWRQKLPEDVLSHATAVGAANVCLCQIRPGVCYRGEKDLPLLRACAACP